jgi:hypothetical protein
MLLHAANILGASDDSELTKVIIGAVFFLFWVLSSIASAISKKNEEAKRKRARDAIAAGTSLPPPLPGARQQAVRRKVQQRVPAVRQPPPAQRSPQQRRIVAKSPRPAPQPVAAPVVPVPPVKPAEPIPPLTVARKIVRPTTATALRNWLQPATLRHQFILTEILQPPLALREPNERT